MSVKMYENLLVKLKNAKKDRKQTMAEENGFGTTEEFKAFLESKTVTNEPTNEKLPTIHVVDIIDCSTSMRDGNKHGAALTGIREGVKGLLEDTNAEFTHTLCDFGSRNDVNISRYKQRIQASSANLNFNIRGCTALYQAVLKVLDCFVDDKTNEKVLVNIYTDGDDNESNPKEKVRLAEMIEDLNSKNYTITFIGTERDVKDVIKNLKVDASNTLAYDGTSKGLKDSLVETMNARSAYSANVKMGKDVSKGFYKTIITK